jgi:hypothetical protein
MNPKIPVVSISPDGERTHYPSIKEAAKAVNASMGHISQAVNFGRKCHGMVWEKVEEDVRNI